MSSLPRPAPVRAALLGLVLAASVALTPSTGAQARPLPVDPVAAVSPAVTNYLSSDRPDGCARGYFCVSIRDGVWNRFRRFDFYRCGTYTLTRWFGSGMSINNQTGGARVQLLGQDKRVLETIPADNQMIAPFYDTVYFIRLC